MAKKGFLKVTDVFHSQNPSVSREEIASTSKNIPLSE